MIAIVAPSMQDVQLLLANMEITNKIEIHSIYIYEGLLNGKKVIIVVTGYGKVNIGRALEYAIDKFTISDMILIGTAGGLNPKSSMLLDAVIVNSTFQFDVDFTPVGDPCFTVPSLSCGIFKANPRLLSLAKLVTKELHICCHTGLVITSDKFIASDATAAHLENKYRAVAVDAECGAAAQVAFICNIPFVAIKVLADFSGNNAPIQYQKFSKEAAVNAQDIVCKLLCYL